MAEDFYSVDEVARIMKLTPGRIRQMPRAGEVDGGVAAVRTEVKVKGVPERHIFNASPCPRPLVQDQDTFWAMDREAL